MNKENFLMYDDFINLLTHNEFILAREKYFYYLGKNKPKIENSENIFKLIENVKRSPVEIGPYQKISVFEALNRIGSDLVLLAGAEKLFIEGISGKKPSKILLRMSTIRGYDYEAHFENKMVIYGEAFNASPSFCNEKMRQAIKKHIDDKKKEGVVFVNEEVKGIIEKYLKENHKLKENPDFKIHPIYCKTKII
jgi:hypothetical protein